MSIVFGVVTAVVDAAGVSSTEHAASIVESGFDDAYARSMPIGSRWGLGEMLIIVGGGVWTVSLNSQYVRR